MKRENVRSKHITYWKGGLFALLLAAWVSVPALISSVKADSTPILVRTAILRAPSGAVNPHGEATWELYQSGDRELEIEIENVNLPTGTSVSSFIDGNLVGQAVLDNNGRARLKLKTEDGQAVPQVNAGSTAEVRSGNTVLVAGVFDGATPTGSGTATASPSQSGSGTASPSPSQSGTVTGTSTPSPSQTGTPGNTPSPSQSGTKTPTPSASQTGTPNNTPSPSQTGTPNNTPSQSQTGTPNNTPSPSQSGTASPSPSATGTPEFRLFAGLTGPTLNGVVPVGFAQFEIHDSRNELEVRVQQINLAIGTSLSVVVDGVAAGQMTIQSGGEGRLRLRTDNGQNVPAIVVGSTILITNGNSIVLSGVFGNFSTPSPSQTGTPGNTPSPSQTGTPSGTPTPGQFGRSFETHLTGSQVTPPVTTAATGEIKITLSADGTQATVFGEFHNLSSNQTGAVILTNTDSISTVFNLGVVGGRNGNFAAVTFPVSAAQVQQLRAGLWSAVIMSVNSPNGEIRGQFRNRSRHSDFDGDGLHDLSVFRPSAGMWYTQNTNGFSARSFGSAADKVVSGDFDGDGKTDHAMYCDENGQGVWEIFRSSDSGVTKIAWGLATDVPVRGDFDGDGRADVAVYRPADGYWYIKQSNNAGNRFTHFGVAEDIPMPSDMDGDGKDDIVVFRPSQGNWYWLRSSDGQFAATNFGLSADIPVSGDFDGDGKADVTVYRPSDGTWYTTRSSDGGFQATRFGISSDIPVAGNYDEDGKTDIAVFRPSDGNWYVLRSSDGTFQAYHFGLNGDIPAIAR